MDRFTRFKRLRAIWARARALMAALGMPHVRETPHRAWRWQQANMAERLIRDGIVRATGDPDSYTRPPGEGREAYEHYQWRVQQMQQELRRQRDEAAHRLWVEQQHRNGQRQRR